MKPLWWLLFGWWGGAESTPKQLKIVAADVFAGGAVAADVFVGGAVAKQASSGAPEAAEAT